MGPLLDVSELAAAQQDCADCQLLVASPRFGVVTNGDGVLVTNVGEPRILLPLIFRHRVFEEMHNLAHPGVQATKRMITRRFLWPGMAKDIATWVKNCLACQRSKIHLHSKTQVEEIAIPTRRFDHLHVDLVGPLQFSSGSTYLLTIVDRWTRWPEAVPMNDITSSACITAMTENWFSRFGVPAVITTDQGPQFTSTAWSSAMSMFGIRHVKTTPYHPQSNGMVERFHRSLKNALRARGSTVSWKQDLPLIMLSLRSTPRDDNGISPAEMVYGSVLALPSAFVDTRAPPSNEFLQRLRLAAASLPAVPTCSAAKSTNSWVDDALQNCSHVWVRRDGHVKPLEPLYDGPFLVMTRSEKIFQLQIGAELQTISVDRLKPVHSDTEVSVQQPRKRGRPPRQPRQPEPPTTDSPPRKKRGRPPRQRSPPPRCSPPPVRRRGRPPKVSQSTCLVDLGGGYAASTRRSDV